ncbi:MAG TPA: hypothetical protein PKE69_23215, partial [Pyrinomonadaceae bacterium]|nr:hypothetical protein [Pyrinomonadaceae bacterium]
MSEKVTNLSEYIAENFGANASYVEGLLSRYKADANSVDESWRTFFKDLLSGASPFESGNGQAAQAVQKAEISEPPVKKQVSIALGADIEVKPITGVGKKIVEN